MYNDILTIKDTFEAISVIKYARYMQFEIKT